LLELTPRKAAVHTCPYCRDTLGESGVIFCSFCQTSLHRECFNENRGCTTLGCDKQDEQYPHCIQCRQRLLRANAIVCIHCGYDLRRGEYYQLEEVPRLQWVMPDWMILTRKGRRMRAEQQRRLRLQRGEKRPFPVQPLIASLIALVLACISYLSENQIVDISAYVLTPIWLITAMMMLISHLRS
jgi:hypothetical protein